MSHWKQIYPPPPQVEQKWETVLNIGEFTIICDSWTGDGRWWVSLRGLDDIIGATTVSDAQALSPEVIERRLEQALAAVREYLASMPGCCCRPACWKVGEPHQLPDAPMEGD